MSTGGLSSLIQGTRPREMAGSGTAGRYGYQTNVGILKLIELRQADGDFCLVFDYFDDLAVLDHPTSPQTIRLYQIKTQDMGEWTMASLCQSVGKTKPRSIISRMYAHSESFGQFLSETALISNAAFKVGLAVGGTTSGGHYRISSADIHAGELDKVSKAVEKDFSPASVSTWLPKLVLIRAPLGVHNHEPTIKGLLNDYFETIGIADQVNLSAIYETLHASIAQKTGFAQVGLAYPDLLARKSLSRADFNHLLDRAMRKRKGFLSDWGTIARDLEKEGKGSADIIRLKTFATRYQIDRNSRQPQAVAFRQQAEAWLTKNMQLAQTCATITAFAAAMQSDLIDLRGFTSQQAHGAFIVEAYEAINATT